MQGLAGTGLGGTRAVIVEDDPSSAKVAAVVLRAEGCDARVVTNADEALAEIAAFEPHVIVLELVLSGVDGMELARQVRAEPAHAGVLIVALTSLNGPEAVLAARAAGIDEYLRKPIDPTTFAELIRSLLRGPK